MKDSKIKNVQPLRTSDQIARFRDTINLLGRFYEEEPKKTGRNQKIRLAVYKIITYFPKILSGNYKRKLSEN